jgi:hypothetical protein
LWALVQGSPLVEDAAETYDEAAKVATCTIKRRGRATATVQRFSRDDAVMAGLWDKQGPWKTNPRRMLQMRARAFAARDALPDVLKGLAIAEEAIDTPPEREINQAEAPKRGAAALREAARAAVDAPPAAPEPQDDAIGAEAASPTAPDKEDAPEAATERPMEDRLADAIAYLDELSTVGEVDAYVREVVPDEVAAVGDFGKAVERRLAAIRAKKAK